MILLRAFFQLIRWPNLLFILLTQVLFYYCVYLPIYEVPALGKLGWLVAASLLIAAAGYIINDYFDLNIDQVNKPDRNVFVRQISRRWAIVWHLSLSALGLIATFAAVGTERWYLFFANTACVLLLWLYSTSFKRQLLVGNIVISLLTAWTVLIVFFAMTVPDDALTGNAASIKFFRVAFLYGGFAFVLSLIREAVKDMEDLEGDARYGCNTLPIASGIPTTKIYVSVWIIVLAAVLIVLQLYILQFGWWPAAVYSLLLVVAPLLHLLKLLKKASQPQHFARISRQTKWIMLTGILSMLFFLLYF
jgi:4-hydroxybenzoate polyprenyltransferase